MAPSLIPCFAPMPLPLFSRSALALAFVGLPVTAQADRTAPHSATLTAAAVAFERAAAQEGTDAAFVSPALESPVPFGVAGPYWTFEGAAADLHVELRASRDGEAWSEWVATGHHERIEKTVEGTDQPNPLAGAWAAGPVLFGAGSRYVQVRVTQPAARGSVPAFGALSVYAVDAAAGPDSPAAEEEQRHFDAQLDEAQLDGTQGVARGVPQPRIYTRGEWGARSPRRAWSYATPVTHLAIHHTASTADGNADTWSECAAAVRGVQNFHMNVNGWNDIGYNYLVCPTGAIFQGREDNNHGSDVVGSHDSYNSRSVGANGLGYYHPPYNQTPPSAMLDGFADLFAWIADRRGIDPSGSSYYAARGITVSNVYGHRQVYATACPGDGLQAQRAEIVRRTEARMSGGGSALTLASRWQRNGASGGRPTWFSSTASTERGLAYGRVGGLDRVYVVSRTGGLRVRVLNAATGADVRTLSTTGISGGTYALNDVEVSTDGIVFAANLTTNTIDTRFRVYRWDSETAAPSRVIDFPTWSTPLRLGDKITVTGKASDNTLKLYAPAASGSYVVEFSTADRGRSFTHRFIDVSSGGALGLSPSVAPFASDFYVASRGKGAKRYSTAGALYGSAPTAAVPTTVGAAKSFADYGAQPARKFLALFDYKQASGHGGYLRVAEVTGGHAGATAAAQSPWLGGLSNPNGTGDVAVKANSDGTFDLFVLSTNNGLAAYRMGGSSLVPDAPAPAAALQADGRPAALQLQASPNPFSGAALLAYALPEATDVTLRVYDLLGREVATLAEGAQESGPHEATFRADGLAGGVYVVRLQAGARTATRRVTLVR